MIRKEAGLFCRTSSSVRLWWELEESKGPKGDQTEDTSCPPTPRRLCWERERLAHCGNASLALSHFNLGFSLFRPLPNIRGKFHKGGSNSGFLLLQSRTPPYPSLGDRSAPKGSNSHRIQHNRRRRVGRGFAGVALPPSGWRTVLNLTSWGCGTKPSTFGGRGARAHQNGEPQ